MKRTLLCALTAVAVSVSSFALTAAVAASDQSAEAAHKERMQHWAADHEAMMDAGLGGMKAALKLTPDQNPLWEAFENAIRVAGKARIDDVRQVMENHERMSSVERLDATAGYMARRADELKKISEAAKPLYGSFDDTQKHKFELLSGEMMMASSLPMSEEVGEDAGAPGLQDIGRARPKLLTPNEAAGTGAFPERPARYPTRRQRASRAGGSRRRGRDQRPSRRS